MTKTKKLPEPDPPPAPKYEVRRTPKNKYQLREAPGAVRFAPSPPGTLAGTLAEMAPPILGEFETPELAADFALKHAEGEFDWQPFDPATAGSAHRREVLERNLRG